MSRILTILFMLILIGCGPGDEGSESAPPRLEEGTWEGGLTPMNHPETVTPLSYEVAYQGEDLSIDLHGPGGAVMHTRRLDLRGDTLYFEFDEPDAGSTLRCALGRSEADGFEGRCTDAEGKWARFTMLPPTETRRP